ncbi:MAG TPA: response regulator transcription factor [Actinomycetota bacterium]|nr:response regulator transcription factor [Actinomycetota bacterium]
MDPYRVIVADDLEDVRTIIRMTLERAGGFEIVGEAEDAEKASLLAQELNVDVVTLDLHMPGMEHLEGARLVKQRAPGARVVLVTGTYHPAYDPDLDIPEIDLHVEKSEVMANLADQLRTLLRG